MNGNKQYLNAEDFPLPFDQIKAMVWRDYYALDNLAAKMGYRFIYPGDDVWFHEGGLRVGMQNWNLHCGWIGMVGDSYHVVEDMITLLNRKVQAIKNMGVGLLVGFCQTGYFSVGYTIYVKGERNEWN